MVSNQVKSDFEHLAFLLDQLPGNWKEELSNGQCIFAIELLDIISEIKNKLDEIDREITNGEIHNIKKLYSRKRALRISTWESPSKVFFRLAKKKKQNTPLTELKDNVHSNPIHIAKSFYDKIYCKRVCSRRARRALLKNLAMDKYLDDKIINKLEYFMREIVS